jgi:iron complex outermembrane recepter protein
MSNRKISCCNTLTALCFTSIGAAAVPAIPAMAQSTGLEPVTVIARKREVNIQDAPVAVSAISGEDFDRSNVVRLDNFNGYVPGLTVAKNDGAGRVVAIRGVGWETAQNLSTQPSVLVYMDGIYVANPLSMGTDLGEIERVDVYRGPQGTEFGQGTTGGAIDVIMKKPSLEDVTGDVQLGYGTYNTIRARGALNVPVGDSAAIRGSIQKYSHDGFAEIEGGALDGYELDDADSLTGTLGFLWEPNDSVSVSLFAFVQDSDQHAAAQKNVDDPNTDERELTQDYPGIFDLENSVFSAIVEWESPSGLIFKSLTGYQKLEKRQSVDGDRLTEALTDISITGFPYQPPPFVGTFASWDVLPFWDNDSDAFSQEFNVLYQGDKLDWVLGAYYLDHENTNFFLEATGASPFSESEDELANPGPATLPPFASVLNFVEDRTVTREDKAIYSQFTYHINDRYAFTAGGRYQDEDQTDKATQFWDCLGGPCPAVEEINDEKFTWKAGLDVQLSDGHLLYGLVSTGWKNGGGNPGARPNPFTNPDGAEDVPVVFKPEEVTSFEIGSKNTFLDDRVRFNVIGFYYDYENLQFMQEDPDPFAGGTGNIPETEIYGVETEFSWLLSDDWRLDGHVAWMDGEFKDDFFALDVVEFREALVPFVFGLFTAGAVDERQAMSDSTNLKGNTPPKLVDLSARIGLTNNHTMGNGAILTSALDYIYRGEYQYRVFNNPLTDTVPSYDVFNLFFNYRPANSALDFSLAATNLFDEDGVNARFSNPFGLLTTSEEFIPPLEVIFSVRYSF